MKTEQARNWLIVYCCCRWSWLW